MIRWGVSAHRLPLGVALSFLALALAALVPASSGASITFGSDLEKQPSGFTSNCFSAPPCTYVLKSIRSGSDFPAASPTDGVVVSFGIKSSAADTVRFRLARLAGGGWIGDGTGPTVTLPSPGKHSFPADVPVQAGDYVGVDTSALSAGANPCGDGASYSIFEPTLLDADAPQTPVYSQTCEQLINAKVRPSNEFTFEKVKRDKERGTATLAVDLPGPGRLTLSGKGIKRATGDAAEAGSASLSVKPKRKTKRRLANRGKASVTAEVTFKPEGGRSATDSERIKLVRR